MSKRYRKKPVVVEAYKWAAVSKFSLDMSRDVDYFRDPYRGGDSNCEHCSRTMHDHGWIDTLEGGHIVCPGDMIITGVQGEKYPCKPDIFKQTYEEAE